MEEVQSEFNLNTTGDFKIEVSAYFFALRVYIRVSWGRRRAGRRIATVVPLAPARWWGGASATDLFGEVAVSILSCNRDQNNQKKR